MLVSPVRNDAALLPHNDRENTMVHQELHRLLNAELQTRCSNEQREITMRRVRALYDPPERARLGPFVEIGGDATLGILKRALRIDGLPDWNIQCVALETFMTAPPVFASERAVANFDITYREACVTALQASIDIPFSTMLNQAWDVFAAEHGRIIQSTELNRYFVSLLPRGLHSRPRKDTENRDAVLAHYFFLMANGQFVEAEKLESACELVSSRTIPLGLSVVDATHPTQKLFCLCA